MSRKDSESKTLEDLAREEFNNIKQPAIKKNPFLGYFIAQRLVSKNKLKSKPKVMPLINIVGEIAGVKPPHHSFSGMKYYPFFALQDILKEDILSGNYNYFAPEGLYLAAKELAKNNISLNIPITYKHIHKKENLIAFLQMPESKIKKKWDPHYFDMTLNNIESALAFMRNKFDQDKDNFFKRYGSGAGTYFLAKDMKNKRQYNFQLRKIYTLIGDGEMLSLILGIKDGRFGTEWNPKVMNLSPTEIDAVKGTLNAVYKEDEQKFYEAYGSSLGAFILSKELKNRGMDISPMRLNAFLVNPSVAQQLLDIEDKQFAKRWNFESILGSLGELDAVVKFIEHEYKRNPDNFFNKYGCNVGIYNLAKELCTGNKPGEQVIPDINLDAVFQIMKNGTTLSRLLGIQDERFKKIWNTTRISTGSYSHVTAVLQFLKENYEKDSDAFFVRYGSKIGLYNLMKDLRANPKITKKPQQSLSDIVTKGNKLSGLLSIEDERFTTHWNPRNLTLNEEQTDNVVGFLANKYKEDGNAFFARYGSEIGLYNLENDLLSECGVKLSAIRLATIAKDPEALEMFLGIKDGRFYTQWNPRSIQTKQGLTGRIAAFLRQEYDNDALRFFIRYGDKLGQYLILKDMEKQNIKISPSQLNSILGSTSLVARLMDIPESKFQGKWNNMSIYLPIKDIDRLVDFLKEKYEADSSKFFETFSSLDGISYLIEALKKEKKISPNPMHLTEFLKDGDFLMSILGVDDERFRTEWNIRLLKCTNKESVRIREFLRERYFADTNAFFEKYGSRTGSYNLACDLRKEKILPNTNLRDLFSLLKGKTKAAEFLGINDPRFRDKWDPKMLPFNLEELNSLLNYLRSEFKKDKNRFFKKYGSRLGTIIIAKEANKYLGILSTKPQYCSWILSDGRTLSDLLGCEDERFSTEWSRRKYIIGSKSHITYKELEKTVAAGFERMRSGCDLPGINEEINKKDPYMLLRHELKTADMKTTLYIFGLYCNKDKTKIKKNIRDSVKKDKEKLAELKKIKSMDDVAEVGEEEFMKLTGHLLYSFDENIRQKTQSKLAEIYATLFGSLTKNYKGFSGEHFMEYCKNFDLFMLHRKRRIDERFTFAKGIKYMAKYWNMSEKKQLKDKNVISLDAPFYRDSNSPKTYHDVVS
ncbi:hypothetical protein HYU07_05800 [Candidatus Woesearchaeota archaeon]|nr:hypothetical protein [Candidatus Woesearchaeota archaeon]